MTGGGEDDDRLIERCLEAKQSASSAFDELYRRHAGAVLSFVHGLAAGDAGLSRDALQETFVRCYVGLPSFERGRPLRPWLLRIARNVTLDLAKRGELRPAAAGAGSLALDGRGLLRRAFPALSAEERAVFLLRRDHQHSWEEVAAALSCSVSTARYRMKAALSRLGREAERLGVTA